MQAHSHIVNMSFIVIFPYISDLLGIAFWR